MNRLPSQAVIEAVEQAESRHRYLTFGDCSCGYLSLDYEGWRSRRHGEVARAAEAAALRAAADDYFNSSSGTKARPHARSWLRARANKLTDTDDRSK